MYKMYLNVFLVSLLLVILGYIFSYFGKESPDAQDDQQNEKKSQDRQDGEWETAGEMTTRGYIT